MTMPMMKCGCVATLTNSKTGAPSCFTHDCSEVAEVKPDLTGRVARCAYYGTQFRPRGVRGGCECDTCRQSGGTTCKCERPSALDLAFFSSGHTGNRVLKATKDYDSFYCGCGGWD